VLQGDTKKTVIIKNLITSKMLFRLTQNFSYIRSSLCSRHLQSFKSVPQKLFVSLALKIRAPNELPGAAGTFRSRGQSSRWPSRIRSVLIVTDRSLSSSKQNGPMMPCFEMATQAVHFTECNGLCRQCSGSVLPQKMLFLEFTWPDNR